MGILDRSCLVRLSNLRPSLQSHKVIHGGKSEFTVAE